MDNLIRKGMRTFALFQCEFGAATLKPTNLRHFEGPIHWGAPRFDRAWKYLGPLPNKCPHPGRHEPLIGTDQNGEWKTVPAAHYPGPLCAFLAKAGGQAPLEKPSPSSGNPSYVAGMEEISQSDATTVFLPGELDFVFGGVAEVSPLSLVARVPH